MDNYFVKRLGGRRGSLPHKLTEDLLGADYWGAVPVPESWQHSLAPHQSAVLPEPGLPTPTPTSACRVGSVCKMHES